MIVVFVLLLQMGNFKCYCNEISLEIFKSDTGGSTEKEKDEKEFFAEVLVIIDQSLNKKLKEKNILPIDYVTNMFNIVNNLYKPVRPKISFHIKSVLIENENIGSLGLTKPLFKQLTKKELRKVQQSFIKYLKDPKSISFPHAIQDIISWKYQNGYFADIIVTMTELHICRFQLVKNVRIDGQFHKVYPSCQHSYMGVRNTAGGACDQNRNVAVVEMKRDGSSNYDDGTVLAHEIGHLLNTVHHQEGRNEHFCKYNKRYVMFDEDNHWSNCSLFGFKKYIPRLSCLQNKPMPWFSGSRVIYFFALLTILAFLFGLAYYVVHLKKHGKVQAAPDDLLCRPMTQDSNFRTIIVHPSCPTKGIEACWETKV